MVCQDSDGLRVKERTKTKHEIVNTFLWRAPFLKILKLDSILER